jgi:hypothetical protein
VCTVPKNSEKMPYQFIQQSNNMTTVKPNMKMKIQQRIEIFKSWKQKDKWIASINLILSISLFIYICVATIESWRETYSLINKSAAPNNIFGQIFYYYQPQLAASSVSLTYLMYLWFLAWKNFKDIYKMRQTLKLVITFLLLIVSILFLATLISKL